MKAAQILERVEETRNKDDRKSSTQPRVDWEEEKTFIGDTLAIRLMKLPLRRPKLKWELLFKGRVEGQLFRGQILESRGQGQIQVSAPLNLIELERLRGEMWEYVRAYFQLIEDARITSQLEWETRKDTKREAPKRGTKGKGV
jgi:hypothetical protein